MNIHYQSESHTKTSEDINMNNIHRHVPAQVTVNMMLQAADTKDSPYTITPLSNGWLITLNSRNKAVTINQDTASLTYADVAAIAEQGDTEATIVIRAIDNSRINLSSLVDQVFKLSLDIGVSHSRLSPHHQIDKIKTEDKNVHDYRIYYIEDGVLGQFNVPRKCVARHSGLLEVVLNHLNAYLKSNARFLDILIDSDHRFKPESYGGRITRTSIISASAIISKRLPSVCCDLKIESDVYTLRIKNLSFETSAILLKPPITVFASYELDMISSFDSIIEKTAVPLLIFVHAINLSNFNQRSKKD